MDLVNEYVNAIHLMNECEKEFEKKKSVKKYNRLSDRNRKIASSIETKYPELKPVFYELLFSDKSEVRAWVAHHILEVMNYENKCRKAAFEEIVRIAKGGSSVEALGNAMWLKQWLDKHPEDRELLILHVDGFAEAMEILKDKKF